MDHNLINDKKEKKKNNETDYDAKIKAGGGVVSTIDNKKLILIVLL